MWVLVVAALLARYTDEECAAALAKFAPGEELSEADRAIARLRLLPHYRRVCPALAEEWDAADRRLD